MRGKQSTKNHPDGAADAMHSEDVQRIIIAEGALQFGHSQKADQAPGQPDYKRGRDGYEARGWSDGGQPGDHPAGYPKYARSAAQRPLSHPPTQRAAHSGEM